MTPIQANVSVRGEMTGASFRRIVVRMVIPMRTERATTVHPFKAVEPEDGNTGAGFQCPGNIVEVGRAK